MIDLALQLDLSLRLIVGAALGLAVGFERGEALLELGRRDEALESYVRALENVRTPGGQLADRARQRIDQLRFGQRAFHGCMGVAASEQFNKIFAKILIIHFPTST